METIKEIIIIGCFLLSSCTPRNMSTIVAPSSTIGVSSSAKANIPRPKSTEEPIIILKPVSYSSYTDLTGTLWIVGEIGTDGPIAIQDVQITTALLNNNGSEVAIGSVMVRYIPPNSKFPFRVSINNAPKEWKEIKIQAQGSPYNDQSINPIYTGLRAEAVTGKKSNVGYELTGKIINMGDKTTKSVDVVAAAYGENGPIIDVGATTLGEIAPGSELSFRLEFSNIYQAPPSYWIYIVSTSK